jgi:hypothetical protein
MKSIINMASDPKAVNNNNLPKKPANGGTPANENKNKHIIEKKKEF